MNPKIIQAQGFLAVRAGDVELFRYVSYFRAPVHAAG